MSTMGRKKYINKVQREYPDLLSSILLLVYGFITVVTPNMRTFDSNGPKFLTLAALNLLVFAYFFFVSPQRKERSRLFRFFGSNVGLAYGLMILMALLSFFKAWNISESILHFSKVFTTFTATWMVCLLVLRDKKSLLPLAIGMSLLLILDSIHTFQGVRDFILLGKGGIGEVKSSYSNKNILTSAIFLKLPFAIWLLYFQKNWTKYLGGLALLFGSLATFFLSARAFLLATITLLLFLFVYAIVRYRKVGGKKYLKDFGVFFFILLLALGTFLLVEKTIYPQNVQGSTDIANRLSTITDKNNNSNNLRLTAWGQSLKIIQKDPLLGVGIGNWKIRVLEYENSYSPTYTYMYKNHNDFLETTAEYGIIGGLAFIAILVMTFLYFTEVLFFKKQENILNLFFLPTVGLIAYTFDAFFNFPQDRPEIQSLFAIYVGISSALSLLQWGENKFLNTLASLKINKSVVTIVSLGLACLLAAAVYILKDNVTSLKLQRIIKEELKSGKLKSSSERFLSGFPAIPNITILEEPIAVQKARYLIQEKKYRQARKLMLNDNSNPFDARKEYFIANTFYAEKQYDSALYYAEKGLKLKPFFYNTNTIAASVYELKGEFNKSIEIWRRYLEKVKNKEEAWRIPAVLLRRQGKLKEAEQLMDSAFIYLPNNQKILRLRAIIKEELVPREKLVFYQQAKQCYENKEYQKAVSLFSQFLKEVPEFIQVYQLRAICYFHLKEYQKAVIDVNTYKRKVGYLPPNMINVRGASYLNLGNKEQARLDFKKAMEMGDKDGRNNYNKFFKKSILFQRPKNK